MIYYSNDEYSYIASLGIHWIDIPERAGEPEFSVGLCVRDGADYIVNHEEKTLGNRFNDGDVIIEWVGYNRLSGENAAKMVRERTEDEDVRAALSGSLTFCPLDMVMH